MKKKTIYFIRFVKILYHFIVLNQKLLNNFCGTISRPNQDYFWRRTIKKTIIHKIFIFCNNNKIIFLTKLPDVNIIFLIQFMEFCMSKIRIRIFQYFWEGVGKICVKKKLQSDSYQDSFSISEICKTGCDIFSGKFRKFYQNFFNSHSRRQIIKNVINCYSQAPNAGFTKTFPGFNCYYTSVIDHDDDNSICQIAI